MFTAAVVHNTLETDIRLYLKTAPRQKVKDLETTITTVANDIFTKIFEAAQERKYALTLSTKDRSICALPSSCFQMVGKLFLLQYDITLALGASHHFPSKKTACYHDIEISWEASNPHVFPKPSISSPQVTSNEETTWNQWRKAGTYYDAKIAVGDQTFSVHKVIVAARCSYFHGLFSSGLRETQESSPVSFQYEGVTPELFETLLTFIYTGELPWETFKANTICDLACLANYVGLNELTQLCLKQLEEKLSPNIFFEIANCAINIASKELITLCNWFVTTTPKAFQSLDFTSSSLNDVVLYLKVADYFKIDTLKNQCLQHLTEALNLATFPLVCKTAIDLNIKSLKKACKEFAKKHEEEFKTEQGHQALSWYCQLRMGNLAQTVREHSKVNEQEQG